MFRSYIIALLLLFAAPAGWAQTPVTILHTDLPAVDHPGTYSPPATHLRHRIEKRQLRVRLHCYGDNTVFNLGEGTSEFSAAITLNVHHAGGTWTETKDLMINQDSPEVLWVSDITDLETISSWTITATELSISSSVLLTELRNDLRIEAALVEDAPLDVRHAGANHSFAPPPAIVGVGSNGTPVATRQVAFTWTTTTPDFDYPNYQLQLLRLYNVKPTKTNPEDITAEVDWSKALTIETQSSAKTITLSVAEGTGFYAWRVRGIGNYFPGGIANHRNWSHNWSQTWTGNSPTALRSVNLSAMPNWVFYMEDPDDDKNYVYSRVLTEGPQNGADPLRVHEQMVYADQLQNPRQTQVYLSEQGDRMVSQSVPDYTGRQAVVSLPVPLTGQLQGYEPKLLQNTEGDPYTAKNFDQNPNTPEQAQITGTHYEYYSDQNLDASIPDAQGFPFGRTVYKTDGTDRVSEQGSPGSTHMMGDQAQGEGHTVRTAYDNTSEAELLRIFGKEAPDASKVLKVITTDPNNVTSVSYLGENGNVLATCLTFNENDTYLDPLPSASDQDNTFNIEKVTSNNTETAYGLVSSQRINVFEPNVALNIDYKLKCALLEDLCTTSTTSTIDCGFKLVITVFDIENGTVVSGGTYEEDITSTMLANNCVNDYYTTTVDPGVTVDAGSYLVTKTLTVTNNTDEQLQTMVAAGDAKLRPLVDLLAGWMQSVYNPADFSALFAAITEYNDNLTAYGTGNYTNGTGDFLADYGLPSTFAPVVPDHLVTLNGPLEAPTDLQIEGCCGPIIIPLVPETPATFDCPASPSLGMPDFEGYMLTAMNAELDDPIDTRGEWDLIMPGYRWQRGDFNRMIYHMLTDVYEYEGVTQVQYDCEELWACWAAMVDIHAQLASLNGAHDIPGLIDGENGGPDFFDSFFDENSPLNNKLVKWAFKKLLSARLRGMDNIEFEAQLPKQFLQCVGYKFARGIYIDNGIMVHRPLAQDEAPAATGLDQYIGTGSYHSHDSVYKEPNNPGDLVYHHQPNPIFAFKYFEYEQGTSIGCELAWCFDGPTTAQEHALGQNATFCEDTPCLDLDYTTWDSEDSFNFYTCLGADPGYVDNEVGADPTSCAEIESELNLTGMRTRFIDECNSGCADRKADFVAQLTAAFIAKCYRVEEGCVDDADVVTFADINAIADSMVADCKRNYCPDPNTAFTTCTEIQNCYVWDQPTRSFIQEANYFDVQYATDCEIEQAAMVKIWDVEITIPDNCAGPANGTFEPWAVTQGTSNCNLPPPAAGEQRKTDAYPVTAASTGN